LLGWVQTGCSERSGFQVGHSSAAEHVERHRSLVVHDLPSAVELPEAERDPDPDALGRRPVHQRAMEPAEAVPERHVVAHGEGQAADLIIRVPEDREDVRPVLQLRFDSDMLSGGSTSKDTTSGA
jgi:hypothetical protein